MSELEQRVAELMSMDGYIAERVLLAKLPLISLSPSPLVRDVAVLRERDARHMLRHWAELGLFPVRKTELTNHGWRYWYKIDPSLLEDPLRFVDETTSVVGSMFRLTKTSERVDLWRLQAPSWFALGVRVFCSETLPSYPGERVNIEFHSLG